MAKINKDELTQEQIAAAMQCDTPEELIELAKQGGYELTEEEAEAFLDELSDYELDGEQLKGVAGGGICILAKDCLVLSW